MSIREIKSILIKRQHICLDWRVDDKYGHWWFEIGDPRRSDSESYGWWPQDPVGLAETLGGVNGELNGITRFGGTATRDPHHGDTADKSFSATVDFGGFFGFFERELQYGSGKGKKCSCVTEDEIKESIREFAKAYSGSWSYPWGQNCHSFQEALLEASCLEYEDL